MSDRYLDISYQNGRPFAAYFYLPRRSGDSAERSQSRPGGLVVDFASDGRPIGIEITVPSAFSVEGLNALLAELHQQEATRDELRPLRAA